MKTKLTTLTIFSIAIIGANGASFFTENFAGGLGPNLAVTYGGANIDATGGDVKFLGTTDGTRGGIGTVDSDYASVDFTATIDVTDNNQAFIGMGPGTSTQPNFFGEPASGPSIFMRVDNGPKGDVFLYNGSETALQDGTAHVLNPQISGINSVRMINNAAADTLEFLYSTDGGVNFTSAGSVNYGATTLGSSTSKIFAAGGNAPSSIDNFSVIPEPAAFALLGIGGLAVILRRRK